MAVLSFTSTDVKLTSGNVTTATVATGQTITAGNVVTLDSNGDIVQAANTSWALSGQYGIYIALTDAAAGQECTYANPDAVIDIGSVSTDGIMYFVSSTAGSVEPYADLTTGDYLTAVCYGDANDDLVLSPIATNTTVP